MSIYNLSVLFLATLPVEATVGIAAGAAVLAAALAILLTLVIYKKGVEKKVGSAEERVKKIVSDAEQEAERQIKAMEMAIIISKMIGEK